MSPNGGLSAGASTIVTLPATPAAIHDSAGISPGPRSILPLRFFCAGIPAKPDLIAGPSVARANSRLRPSVEFYPESYNIV
jgi:hypothetical protein